MAAFPEVPILALAGCEENIKITRPIDMYIADRLLLTRQAAVPQTHDQPWPDGVVVVVGGGSGIGAALVELLRSEGRDVASLSRRSAVDVRDESAVRDALRMLVRRHGSIAAVVNTAGILTRGSLMDLTEDQLREEVAVNLTGGLHVARAAHPFLRNSRGHLVLFTSSSYTRGRAGYAVYSATKAAVVNMAQALAEEWLRDGIKVNCINPARTKTPMRIDAFGLEPDDSLLDPSTVARAVVSVVQSQATGHVYDVRLDNRAGAPAPITQAPTAAASRRATDPGRQAA